MATDDCTVFNTVIYPALFGSSGVNPKAAECCVSQFVCDPLRRILELDLSNSGLKGQIPSQINSLSALKVLTLSNNSLTGTIPEITSLTSLVTLQLNSNQLNGNLPSDLTRLGSLQRFNVADNRLKGILSKDFALLKSLKILRLENNQISGSIPETLSTLEGLNTLSLGDNSLTGSIPSSFGDFRRLQTLHLNKNSLSGPIPNTIGKLSTLEELDLSSNSLSGGIPDAIGDMTQLMNINLKSNKLEGTIPTTLGKLKSLKKLDFSENLLSGTVPDEVKNLPNYSSNTFIFGNLREEFKTEDTIVGLIIIVVGVILLVAVIYLLHRWIKRRFSAKKANKLPPQFTGGIRPNVSARYPEETVYLPIHATHGIDRNENAIQAEYGVGFGFAQPELMEHSTEVPATIVTIGNIENAPEQIEDNIITNDMPQDVTTTVGNIKNIKPCSPSNETPVYNTYTINSIDRTADNHMNNTEILSEETIFRPVEPKSIFTPGKQFVTKPLRGNTIVAASTGSSSNGIPASTFFFSNMLIDNSFLELATSTFLPVNDVLEATKSFSQSEPGEISVSKGDKLTIIEHLLDGWCVGINISQSSKGRFPIESVAYNAKVQLHFIYCFTADSEEILVLPDLVKYVQNNFVNSITIHHISIDKLKESDLYPVFGTLTGDERCIVHGSTEFKELMHKFLDDFGESFWKKLDIKRIN